MRKSASAANVLHRPGTAELYAKSLEDFWDEEGRRRVAWFRGYTKLYEWDLPHARWLLGGLVNACFNCVDRHVEDGRGAKVAYVWEGEPAGDRRELTFAELQREVVKLANGLKALGVRRGARVAIYMGMVPELPIAMLACARIGAAHAVVSPRLSPHALTKLLNELECSLLITQDEACWRGEAIALKKAADRAMAGCRTITRCVVLRRTGGAVSMTNERDLWWQHLTAEMASDPRSCPCEPMESEDILCVIYPDPGGSLPAGFVHTTGGYLVGTATTHDLIFDVRDDTVYWCTAEIASVLGHGYVVYGPLCNGTTSVIYEGGVDDRLASIVERNNVSVLFTTAETLRSRAPACGESSSLRVLGVRSEAGMAHSWRGSLSCALVEPWWRADDGMILISALAGTSRASGISEARPFPGVEASVVDDRGRPVPTGAAGHLVIRAPYPAMPRGLFGRPEQFRRRYWEPFPGAYFTGELARIDADGAYHRVVGRRVEEAAVGRDD